MPLSKVLASFAMHLTPLVFLKDGEDLRFSAHHGSIPIALEKWPINRNWVTGARGRRQGCRSTCMICPPKATISPRAEN